MLQQLDLLISCVATLDFSRCNTRDLRCCNTRSLIATHSISRVATQDRSEGFPRTRLFHPRARWGVGGREKFRVVVARPGPGLGSARPGLGQTTVSVFCVFLLFLIWFRLRSYYVFVMCCFYRLLFFFVILCRFSYMFDVLVRIPFVFAISVSV